jgi:hypothetical protein
MYQPYLLLYLLVRVEDQVYVGLSIGVYIDVEETPTPSFEDRDDTLAKCS